MICWSNEAVVMLSLEDYESMNETAYLLRSPENAKRINIIIKDIQRNKYEGIGKPAPLKHNLSGYWSRSIDSAHRIVYKIENNSILIAQLRYHY